MRAAFICVYPLLVPCLAAAQERGNYGKPGAEHQALQRLIGKWSLTLTMPGAAESKGVSEFKSILGGRFVQEETSCDFGRQKFEWLGLYGYDPNKKKLTAVWVDNLDTTTETGEGPADPAGKAFHFRGEHPDPRTGKSARFQWNITLQGNDRFELEMRETPPAGQEASVMKATGVRMK